MRYFLEGAFNDVLIFNSFIVWSCCRVMWTSTITTCSYATAANRHTVASPTLNDCMVSVNVLVLMSDWVSLLWSERNKPRGTGVCQQPESPGVNNGAL